MTKNVLFIHSLFRSGSTYLFNCFRQANDNIYCYQEPLNEFVFNALDQPEGLLALKGSGEMQRRLKHPEMDHPYFAELYETVEFWKPFASPEISYDDYFGLYSPAKTNAYFSALIKGAKKKNVMIQECRTGARIGNIKSEIGGYHIHLWRNPLNQWWSFKATEYFEVIMQVIASAKSIPPLIQKICDATDIAILPHHSFLQQLRHFEQRWVSSHNSYMLFFGLWCLNMLEGLEHADMILSIDKLSQDIRYKAETESTLSEIGFSDINLSDCNIPQSTFSDVEMEFYREIEDEVFKYLRETGVQNSALETLRTLTYQNLSIVEEPEGLTSSESKHLEAIESLRSIVLRAQTARELQGKNSNTEISILNRRVLDFQEQEGRSAQKSSDLETKKIQLETSLMDSEKALLDTRKEAALLVRQLNALDELYANIKNDNEVYKKSLMSHASSLKKLSNSIELISQQNEVIHSDLSLTRSKFETEREHYEILRKEHERLLNFLPTVEEKFRHDYESGIAEYEKVLSETLARDAQRQETETGLRSQIQAIDRSLKEKEAHLDAVLKSSSWRATHPLRVIFNLKRHIRKVVNRVLLWGLNFSRSSPVMRAAAMRILTLFPKLSPKVRKFASSHPVSALPDLTPIWNLQINENSVEKWQKILEKGNPS